MKLFDAYQSPELVKGLAARLATLSISPATFMEVCGTHTMSLFRHGLRDLFPPLLRLISGPGCPVCVTNQTDIDNIIALAKRTDTILATFGDLIRVPGKGGSLSKARSGGAHVEIVYSPIDCLTIARNNPNKQVVFAAIGFETTIPSLAATILEAARLGIDNFSIYPCLKTMPPALYAILGDKELKLDGLLLPGHVSAITGSAIFEAIAKQYQMPCVVAGFEPVDMMQAIAMLLEMRNNNEISVKNAYPRAVTEKGNLQAQKLIEKVFVACDATWRGLGHIPKSGLAPNQNYDNYNAVIRFKLDMTKRDAPPNGCLCGEVIKGKATPSDCRLFAKVCTPSSPVGPCMVSTEGTCAAWQRYGHKIQEGHR